MQVLNEIVMAIWYHDFAKLINPDILWIIYAVLFTIIVLENGILPAAFLPGDTLLILSGALIAKGVLSFIPTIIILTIAASLGCWLGFLQGRWLSDTNVIKQWLKQIPQEYHDRANRLFDDQGLYALLFGRFLAFVRTLLPVLAGLSTLSHRRFQLFNWLSGLLWIGIIVSLGYAINQIPFIKRHENIVMNILIFLPILLLISGLIGSIVVYWKHKKAK
ncbi:DedA family protein [Arsenophonus apicola]|uniref:DedA family protein n=1 Tax=Arsenophonus apicola TaxID=2879119 RepID=A0ABY8P5L8_9GAMM|nr:DedA family protein [Arsenophonus apicola]WGO84110.1 DedA family protein [Arsenophonus apicola]